MDRIHTSEKGDVAQHEVATHHHEPRRHSHKISSEVGRIDAIALAPETTMETFAHLDQKKILRKMDMRLIPMLALLYLLSFLDRMFLLIQVYLLCQGLY
jgi:hypothetical protein